MQNFEYFTPTRVVFGKGSETQVGELVKAQNCAKALVHYGGNSAKASGLLDRVCRSLEQAGIAYCTLGGVVPNPRLSKVREGIALCKKEGVDFLLAVGGGSVIDSAKAIGYGLANSCDVWDLYLGAREPVGCLPVGAVLTIAAAGSEMSNSSVITNEEGGLKKACNTDYGRCRFAVMNPELTFTLPPYQTGCGCADILMHTMERYFTTEKNIQLTSAIAEGLMRTVLHNAPLVLADPENYEARAEIMWAGSLSHNGLTGCGGLGDFATHLIEHELSGMFDVAHGAGLTAVWASWARYVYREDVARFVQFAVNVMGVYHDFDHPEQVALAGIAAMERFFQDIGMPVSIPQLLGRPVTSAQMEEMADKCMARPTGNFRKLSREDVVAIYSLANK